jgi:hypothetical protein
VRCVVVRVLCGWCAVLCGWCAVLCGAVRCAAWEKTVFAADLFHFLKSATDRAARKHGGEMRTSVERNVRTVLTLLAYAPSLEKYRSELNQLRAWAYGHSTSLGSSAPRACSPNAAHQHVTHCVVLCCAVLCCAVLCCAVLCCAVLSAWCVRTLSTSALKDKDWLDYWEKWYQPKHSAWLLCCRPRLVPGGDQTIESFHAKLEHLLPTLHKKNLFESACALYDLAREMEMIVCVSRTHAQAHAHARARVLCSILERLLPLLVPSN